jgi:hypothetical protein
MPPTKISLDQDNPTLNDLLKSADAWKNEPVSGLSHDQIAILNLKKALDTKAAGLAANECFICATGA